MLIEHSDAMQKSEELLEKILKLDSIEALAFLCNEFENETIFSTSFGMEDQAITHLISSQQIKTTVFTIDTGRLFPETYTTWSNTMKRYSIPIKAYYPEAEMIQNWVEENGPNAFYESIEQRKSCCEIRKVVSLKKALLGKKLWITGLRAEQSMNRNNLSILEWDNSNQIFKYHPLLNWTGEMLNAFILKNNIPYNPLHDKGYVSIGCAPCTRAIKSNEDFRAGRWWWEENTNKECGLHKH